MEKIAVCKAFGYRQDLFELYEYYLQIKGCSPIEYSLDSSKKIKEYLLKPEENYSFISFCKENYVMPFEDALIDDKRKCANCAFLRNEINGDRTFCGEEEVFEEGTCENHMFRVDTCDSFLNDMYHR